MKLSIIIPTYRGQDKIHNILSAIFSVNNTSFECIVVNDGSDDYTADTLDYFSSDLRLKVIDQENKGQAKARLNALKYSEAGYVLFIDDDDDVDVLALVKFLDEKVLEKDLYVFPYSYQRVDSGSIFDVNFKDYDSVNDYKADLLYGSCHYGCFLWNRIFKKEILLTIVDELNNYDAPGEDLVFNLLYVDKVIEIEFVPINYYCYMVYDSSFTKSISRDKYDNYIAVNSFISAYVATGFDDVLIESHQSRNMFNIKRLAAKGEVVKQRGGVSDFFRIAYKVMSLYKVISNKIGSLYFYIYGFFHYSSLKNYSSKFNVIGLKETLQHVKNGFSVARFGDGEMRLLTKRGSIGFQKASEDIANCLRDVISTDSKSLLLCLPMLKSSNMKVTSKLAWASLLSSVGDIEKFISKDKVYGNAFISRPYIDYKKPDLTIFTQFQDIFSGKKILIVNGYNNNLHNSALLKGALDIKRIAIPNKNAFSLKVSVSKKIDSLLLQEEFDLVVFSCGPLASYLAYVHHQDIQCLDIGHIDIEYEWSLLRATKKVSVDSTTCGEV